MINLKAVFDSAGGKRWRNREIKQSFFKESQQLRIVYTVHVK
jgi:hypothetical protein